MIGKKEIEQAYENIRSSITETPMRRSYTFSEVCGCNMLLKMENLQMSGAFKERGALNRLLQLSKEEQQCGVIAASAGNHAQGVAYHAHRMGLSATIVMPERTPLVKVTGVQFWGAHVILHGANYDEAYAYSRILEKEQGLIYIHPFADPFVIAGQGTIALEILQSGLGDDLDAIVVPIGGGGLIAGIGAYVKAVCPSVRVIGVELEGLACMKESLSKGAVQTLPAISTIADGIAVKRVSETTLEMCKAVVDEIVTVTDDEIANTILQLLEYEKVVVEGAGAVAVAAILNKKIKVAAGKTVVSVISGGNIDVNILSRIIDRGLDVGGRIAQFSTRLKDQPGALENVLSVFNKASANVLEVYQHRYSEGIPVGQVNVSLTIESKNKQHIVEIEQYLQEAGYEIFQTRWDPITPGC